MQSDEIYSLDDEGDFNSFSLYSKSEIAASSIHDELYPDHFTDIFDIFTLEKPLKNPFVKGVEEF